MKSCPTCNRTYPDDTLAFCLMDGSVLSAPYDPETGKDIQRPHNSSPPATELIRPPFEPQASRLRKTAAENHALPPTIAPPPATTIQASPPSVAPPPRTAKSKVSAEDFEHVTKVWDTEVAKRKAVQNKVRFVIFALASLIFALLAAFTIEDSTFRLIGVGCSLLFAGAAWGCWRAARGR